MSVKDQELDKVMDQAIAEIRDERPDPRAEQIAGERVWARLSRELARAGDGEAEGRRIRDCSGFREMIPDYLDRRLGETRALLFEDHVGECLPCRKALKAARAGRRPEAVPAPARSKAPAWITAWGWQAAAAVIVLALATGIIFKTGFFSFETGGTIQVQSIEGELFRVTEGGGEALSVGDRITLRADDGIRMAKNSRAMIRLADDSRVELKERTELEVKERRGLFSRGSGDAVLELTRGSIIVEASDQGSGHLFVDTSDCEVTVTGTVFAVNHGIKGSRVSVIEGEVQVDFGGSRNVIRPGHQITTRPELFQVAIEDEIAWSAQVEQHIELLQQFVELGREIDEAVNRLPLRRSTALLDIAPRDTVVYIAIPNVSTTVEEAYQILQKKIGGNAVLREWWQRTIVDSDVEQQIEQVIDRIRAYGSYLGEEVVLALSMGENGVEEPVVLAELSDAEGFRALVQGELEGTIGAGHVVILEGDFPVPAAGAAVPSGDALNLWLRDGLLVAGPRLESIQRLAEEMRSGATGGTSAFKRRLADVYREGVAWLVGVDMQTLLPADARGSDALARMGILDLQHLIGERKEKSGRTEHRVVLTFDQPRRGLIAWLAEPSPMGTLDFISPEANLAAAFVMKEPSVLVEELFEFIGSEDPEFDKQLSAFETEHQLSIRDDFAAALGGEFAFAMDGPLLPTPSWKLVVEVYAPSKLQSTLEWTVDRLDRLAKEAGKQGFRIGRDQLGGRDAFVIESLDTGISAHYVYADGYLIAAPSRPLLDRALQIRDTGINLPSSPGFSSLLPQDGQVNFSAAVYQNMGPILGPLSQALSGMVAGMSQEQQQIYQELGATTEPSLTLAYGETNRLVFVNESNGGLFGSGLGALFNFKSLLGVQELLGHAQSEACGGVGDDETANEVERIEREEI